MRTLISYDISHDKRRRKVAKIMEGAGYRVQYSVFECDLSAQQLRELQKRLKPLVKKEEGESIRFYPLPADALTTIQVLGKDHGRTLATVEVV